MANTSSSSVVRRSVSQASEAANERAKKRLEQKVHELNNAPNENVFREGSAAAGAKPGAGLKYNGLGGVDTTLIVKRLDNPRVKRG